MTFNLTLRLSELGRGDGVERGRHKVMRCKISQVRSGIFPLLHR